VNIQDTGRRVGTAGGGYIQARLMLVLLCLIWGNTWPLMKIALEEMPPLSMRVLTAGIGALTLVVVCLVKRSSLRVPTARAWVHVVVASLLNVVSFSLFSAFAQNSTATSRVAVLTYTMPIWTVFMAWLVLGERPTRVQGLALALCVFGLAILIRPLATTGIPLGIFLALASGVSWAAGTVYLKWARIQADPLGVASWQLTIAFFIIAACLLVFEHGLHLGAVHADGLFATVFVGVAGAGLAYAMWFDIVRRLPAATASLGILGIPVIGVVSSVLILGERPTTADVIGFALIFAASACVLLGPPPPRRVSR
jgi:drug/metabolite transporter (DMT)-like permease